MFDENCPEKTPIKLERVPTQIPSIIGKKDFRCIADRYDM